MKKVILAAINLKDSKEDFDEKIEELKNLCIACNMEVAVTIIQNSRSMDPQSGFRKGKVEELLQLVKAYEVEEIVFYNTLSLTMATYLADLCQVDIIDRTTLILDIFYLRATSAQAKIQTEIARLKYALPRMLNIEYDNDKQRGGTLKNKGSGEKRSALIKKKVEKEIASLNRELAALKNNNDINANKRNNSGLKKVALVGYTNAGKSSLTNAILRYNNTVNKDVFSKDMLFATLDTSTRKVKYQGYEFLLFDTVGFVSDLPHELIEAFNSTLSCVLDADLLINVLDSSSSNLAMQKSVTMNTLKSIGADHIKVIDVYNKCDLNDLNEFISVSATNDYHIKELLSLIVTKLNEDHEARYYHIGYEKAFIMNKYTNALFTIINEDDGYDIEVRADKVTFNYIEEIIYS